MLHLTEHFQLEGGQGALDDSVDTLPDARTSITLVAWVPSESLVVGEKRHLTLISQTDSL